MTMENMLCNVNRLHREDMERLVFEKVKDEEKTIMKSLSYRKYCKIKDLTSMFNKTQPIIAYNTDPKDDYNQWKDIIKEDVTRTISKLCTEHRNTVTKLNNKIASLNSNINSMMSEAEAKKNRWRSKRQEYKQYIEELTAQEEKLRRRYEKTKNRKKELLKDIENLNEENGKIDKENEKLNEEKEKLNGENKNFEQKVKNLNEELTDLKVECKELKDIVNYHARIANNEENKLNEEDNPYDNLKKNISNLKENLSQKIIENENLNVKLDEIRTAEYEKLKELIQGIMDSEDSFKRLSRILDKFLDESSEYDEEKCSDFINFIMNFLVIFPELKVFEEFSEQKRMEVKDIFIDFLFRFKDRHPFGNSKGEGPMEYFDRIMDFMRDKKLKPSKSLREEYSKSEFNKKMVLPSFEVLNKKIGMTKEAYSKLEERYNSKGAFNYFFNTNIDVQIEVGTNKDELKFLKVGFLKRGTNEQIGAAMWMFDHGELYQGYFKDNRREYYGRDFYADGHFYEGGHRQGKRHGHGELQYTNGDRYVGQWKDDSKHGQGEYKYKDGTKEVGHWVDGKMHGPADYYDTHGNMSERMYKDGVRVDN